MKILCVMFEYDYGQKTRGYSFEYNTFYKFFKKQGHKVQLYDLAEKISSSGKKQANKNLKNILGTKQYDLVFCVPFTNQLDLSIFKAGVKHQTPFVAWMCDDKWRWETYGRKICWIFDYVITTDLDAVNKYKKIGYENIILSQWGYDVVLPKTKVQKYLYDVSFVGQINPWRKYVVDRLRSEGINIQCFGYGWKNGRVDNKKMKKIFRLSKINLNISNSVKWDLGYLTRINWSVDKKLDILHRVINMFPFVHTFFSPKKNEDIKARFFEVTGSGGFLLSYHVNHIERYFRVNEEILCYKSLPDMIKKIRYFLKNEKERIKIMNDGLSRTKRDHLYEKRFNYIFEKIGLKK